jgi:preprotein translocase SecE subunit
MNLSTYFKEIQKELRLTTFPSQNIVITFTTFVIIFTGAMAVYLGALDVFFGETILSGINNYKTPIVEIATTTDASVLATTTTASVTPNILVK